MGKNGTRNTRYLQDLRVALVYDRVNKWGGAERVVIALKKIFPHADLYTSVYEESKSSWASKINVIPSFLQSIPFARSHHEWLGALMPLAFESFKFNNYDLVISVTSESAKGVITGPQTKHLSIILTPTRYLWSGYKFYFKNKILKRIATPIVWYLRTWDKVAANRPDKLIAISEVVRTRISKYYGLASDIIYPPLMIKSHKYKREVKNYYLVVSRLVPYKRVDLAIKAANKLKFPLKVIGTGSEYDGLRRIAGNTVEFIGYAGEDELKQYYSECKALIFPGIEDFGLVMIEAQSFGAPVIAYRAGGAVEIVKEGTTGEFFDKQNVVSLINKLKTFSANRYNTDACKKNAQRFTYEIFEENIKKAILNL